MRYKVNGRAEMADTSLVRAHGESPRLGVSLSLSMVRESSVTVVSGASRIPFERSSRIRRFPWRCRSSTIMEKSMAMRKREDEVFPNAAGVDVGASSHWVAVPPGSTDAPVREFGAMTDDLAAMADWLLACGVEVVALESTGVYWIPVYEVLESRGLLRAAFRPAAEVCAIRAVARQREVLLTEQAGWLQRMQKALVQMNIQLTEVISDVMGQTGQAILRDIVAGERDAKGLARHRHRRMRASEADIVRALTGHWREAQPGAPSVEEGGHEPVAQRLGTGRPLSKAVRPYGQAPGEHRHRAQTGAHGLHHAHPGGVLRRSGPTALRGTAARTQQRSAQAPCRRPGIPDQPLGGSRMKSATFSAVS